MEWWKTNSEALIALCAVAALVLTAIVLFILLKQLAAMVEDRRQDHQRRRAEFTLSFWHEVMHGQIEARDAITQEFGTNTVDESTAQILLKAASESGGTGEDVLMGQYIRNYLNVLERLSVGVHLGILDEEVLKGVGRFRFIHSKRQLYHFIFRSMDRADRHTVHAEFLALATTWEDSGKNRMDRPGTLKDP